MTRGARRALITATAFVVAMAGVRTAVADPPRPSDLTVHFRDRTIDLAPFLEGFPFVRVQANYEASRMFYFREDPSARELWSLPIDDGPLDLTHGTRIGTIDWNTRAFRDAQYDASHRSLVIVSDDANEERYDLFSLSLDSGALTRLTDKPYVYGFGIDKQDRRIAYVARYGTHVPYRACLNVIDLETRADREIVCDTPALALSWTYANFTPDGLGVVLNASRDGDRGMQNLVYVDLGAATPTLQLLTDANIRRRNVGTLREWIDARHFVFTSDEGGFTNLYVYDLAGRAARAITRFRQDIEDAVPIVSAGHTYVAAIAARPWDSELFVVDPDDGAIRAHRVFDATVSFIDHRGDRAMLREESRQSAFMLQELRLIPSALDGVAFDLATRARVPESVAMQTERCDVERVAVPTFDVDPRTGRTRELHAYLETPRDAPRGDQSFALVEAFYGGENRFDTTAEILCAAGATVLSPSVRGSRGFGAEFAALNDHDLGGNEIVDLIYSARFLESRFGLAPARIGVYGASHGGYAAMRALTFPTGVNGHTESMQWGFGISWYGFSNIVTFHEHSNIPDWVLLEAGDPRTEAARLLDRSPVSHAALATGPLLLLHGERDSRVPVDESRQMAVAMRAAHRSVTYVEFPGQGHALDGTANQLRVWTEVFRFLDAALDAPRRPTQRASRWRRHARAVEAAGVMLVVAGVAAALARGERRRPRSSRSV